MSSAVITPIKPADVVDQPASPYLTLDEACSYLRVKRQTFKNWRSQGRGPQALKLGGTLVRYTRDDLDAWARTQREVA